MSLWRGSWLQQRCRESRRRSGRRPCRRFRRWSIAQRRRRIRGEVKIRFFLCSWTHSCFRWIAPELAKGSSEKEPYLFLRKWSVGVKRGKVFVGVHSAKQKAADSSKLSAAV